MAQRLEKDGLKTGRSPSPLAGGCSSSNTAVKRCSPDGNPAIGRASGRTSLELNPAIWRQVVELLFCSQRSTTVVPRARAVIVIPTSAKPSSATVGIRTNATRIAGNARRYQPYRRHQKCRPLVKCPQTSNTSATWRNRVQGSTQRLALVCVYLPRRSQWTKAGHPQ
jgi:hypothetical protein